MIDERQPDEYYMKKYGVLSKENYENITRREDIENYKVGQPVRPKGQVTEIDMLNPYMDVVKSAETPWGYVIEMKMVWVTK